MTTNSPRPRCGRDQHTPAPSDASNGVGQQPSTETPDAVGGAEPGTVTIGLRMGFAEGDETLLGPVVVAVARGHR